MLELKNVSVVFNEGTINEKQALRGVDLTVRDGEFVTVIGGNGAGKSTLLNVVAGVYRPQSGSIRLDGEEISNLPEYRRAVNIGRVFQDPMEGTVASMTIEENLAMANKRGQKRSAFSFGVRRSDREFFKERLETLGLGLEDRAKTAVGLLSGGQRQALTLLMATMQKPKLLLLDEHTAALDPKTAEKVSELTERIVRENGLTTLMVTHNMRHALRHGDRLIMMHEGRVAVDVSGEEKQAMSVEDLLRLFEQRSGEKESSDRLLL